MTEDFSSYVAPAQSSEPRGQLDRIEDGINSLARIVARRFPLEGVMGAGMARLLEQLRSFHNGCDVPILEAPMFPDAARVKLRLDILEEEHNEFRDAVAARNLAMTADALADIIYVAVGTALEFGIPLDRVWAEVHRSNMAKVDPFTGKAERRADGKVLKPLGWTPPDIDTALYGKARGAE